MDSIVFFFWFTSLAGLKTQTELFLHSRSCNFVSFNFFVSKFPIENPSERVSLSVSSLCGRMDVTVGFCASSLLVKER